MRETDNKLIDYEKLRNDQLKNFDKLYDNINTKMHDEDGLR